MPSQSNRPQQKTGQQGNAAIFATIAAVGVGAVAAVGAYFMGRAAGEEEGARNATRLNAAHSHDLDEADLKKPRGDGSDEKESEECSICFREYEEVKRRNEEIHTTPCGHVYCERCINTCLDIKEECPKCKRRVRKGQTLRIFL